MDIMVDRVCDRSNVGPTAKPKLARQVAVRIKVSFTDEKGIERVSWIPRMGIIRN